MNSCCKRLSLTNGQHVAQDMLFSSSSPGHVDRSWRREDDKKNSSEMRELEISTLRTSVGFVLEKGSMRDCQGSCDAPLLFPASLCTRVCHARAGVLTGTDGGAERNVRLQCLQPCPSTRHPFSREKERKRSRIKKGGDREKRRSGQEGQRRQHRCT